MADNSAQIARLKKLIDAAVTGVTVDGTTTSFDLEEARRRLRELEATHDTPVVRKPRAASIDLSHF